MPRRRILFIVTGLVVAAASAGWWRAETRRAVIRAGLPPPPAVEGWPEEFRARLRHARDRAAGRWNSTAALGELSRLYHANGFLRAAMQCYSVLEKLEPSEPRWLHRHATLLAGFGEAEAALARWRQVGALAPDYLPAKLKLGDLLLKTNQADQATAVFSEVLQRAPDHPHAVLGLARIDLEAQRWEAARTRLEAVVAQTNYALGYDLIVTVYEHFGDSARAQAIRGRAKASGAYREVADPWIDEMIDDCQDVYRLALAAGDAARNGETSRAVALLERAVSLAPDDVPVRFQLATLLAARRDAAGAQAHFERCTRSNPAFADAWAHWAALRQQAGDTRGAVQLVEAGLRHAPDSPGLHLMRARQRRDAGDAPGAIAAFEVSIRLRGNEADAHLELATMLFRLERVPEGVQWLERGLLAEPEHPPTLVLLALHAIGNGNLPAARAWLQRVAEQPRVPAEQVVRLREAFRKQFDAPPP